MDTFSLIFLTIHFQFLNLFYVFLLLSFSFLFTNQGMYQQ